jgi:beta-glucanase (GH16 family)
MKRLFGAFLLVLFVCSCETSETFEADIVLDPTTYVAQEGEWFDQQILMNLTSSSGALSYDIQVPAAGRYKVEVIGRGSGEVWIEDYRDNEDGRTYNITGAMRISSEDESVRVGKDGSPLNAGVHPIKLHANSEDYLIIEKILFTKMIDHQVTPEVSLQSLEGEDWELVWSDEFEVAGAPDTTKWIYDVGNWGWGNNEPQYYTDNRRENARVENGNLIIEARKNDMGQEWTSARLTTRGKTSFLYGKYEFRAKVPAADGTWAAGWFLGDKYVDELSWPYCGEIDVLECVGSEIDNVTGNGINHGSCHTRSYYFKEGTHITAVTDVEDMVNTFHTYAIEWTPTEIKAFVDDVHYYTYDKNADELEWPFNNPQNIILNLAMGGGMGGEIDPSIESQQFIIDYVRVYGK